MNGSAQNIDLNNSLYSPKHKSCKVCSSGRNTGRSSRNKREFFSPPKHQGCQYAQEFQNSLRMKENTPNIISPKYVKSPSVMSPKNNRNNLGRFNPSGKYVQLKSTEKTVSLLSPTEVNPQQSVSLLSPNLKSERGNKKLISLISIDNL